MKPIRFLRQEALIINDEIQRAGSGDYLMQIPAGVKGPDGNPLENPMICIGDLKTGKSDPEYPAGLTAQLAAYGLGWIYDQDTNSRSPLHPEASREWGVLVHFPLLVPNSTVSFYWVNLDNGLRAAKMNNSLDNMIKFFRSVEGKPIKFEVA